MAASEAIMNDIWFRMGIAHDTSNVIYCIVGGDKERGNIIRFIGNLEGKVVEPLSGEIRPLKPGEDPNADEDYLQTQLRKWGKRFVRIPIKETLKILTVDRVVYKKTADKTSERLKDKLSAQTMKVYGLLAEFPRPTYHEAFDSKQKATFSIVSLATIEVINARPIFEKYSDNFLEMLSEKISGFLSERILKLTIDQYQESEKSFHASQLDKDGRPQLEGLNQLLLELGLKCTMLSLSDPELPIEIQRRMEAAAIAAVDAEADRLKGQGAGDKKFYEMDGEARGIARIAEANARRVGAVVDVLHSNGEGLNKSRSMIRALEHVESLASADAVGKNQGTFALGANVGLHSWNKRPEAPREDEEDELADEPAESTPVQESTQQPAGVARKPTPAPATTSKPHKGKGRNGKNRPRK
jgi:hypothetical protein